MSEKEKSEIYFSWSGMRIPLDKEFERSLNSFIEDKIKKIIESPEFEDLICKSMIWYSQRVKDKISDIIKIAIGDSVTYNDFSITLKPTRDEDHGNV